MEKRATVSSAEFIRNVGHWQCEAMKRPVYITHHGRERLVLAAPDSLDAASFGEGRQAEDLRAVWSTLLGQLEDGFIEVDSAGVIVGSNPVAEMFVGKSSSDLCGTRLLDIMPQPLAARLWDCVRRVQVARATESLEGGDFAGRRLSVRLFPLNSGVGILFHNVTELSRLRHEVQEERALTGVVRDHPRIAIARTDSRGRIEEVNGAVCECLGFGGDELIGHRLADLAQSSQRRDLAARLDNSLKGGAPIFLDVAFVNKRGSEIVVAATVASIECDSAPVGQVILWLHDGGAS